MGRGGDGGVRPEHDYVRLQVTVLDGRVHQLHGQLEVPGGAREDNRNGHHVRRCLKEGPFGSDRYRESYYRGGPSAGGSRSR